jgi:hypothetical protein
MLLDLIQVVGTWSGGIKGLLTLNSKAVKGSVIESSNKYRLFIVDLSFLLIYLALSLTSLIVINRN